jgi:hypothetical protein
MSSPKQNASPEEMRKLAELNKALYGTKPKIQPMPPKPSPINQRNYDRLVAKAEKGPLSQIDQRNLAFATKKLGMNSQPQTPPIAQMPRIKFQGDTGGGMIGTMGGTGYDLGTASNLGTAGGGMPPAGNVQQTVSGGPPPNYGGMTMKKGGSVSSASKRADGIATKGKTRGKYI